MGPDEVLRWSQIGSVLGVWVLEPSNKTFARARVRGIYSLKVPYLGSRMGQIWGPGMRVPGMPWDRVRRGYPGIRGLGRSGGSKYGVQIWGPKIDHYLDVFNRDELGDFRISDFGGLDLGGPGGGSGLA